MIRIASLWLLVLVCGGCAGSKQGILVMAHGGDDAWNQAVGASVEPLRSKYPVEIAFGMARRSTLKEAVGRLEARGVERVAVVRMFISGDSFLDRTERILRLRPPESPSAGATHHAQHASHDRPEHASHDHPGAGHHHMEPAEPIETNTSFVLSRKGVGESSLVDRILFDRVKALSTDPSRESVLILAHGPADEAENERWLANMRLRAQGIHEIGPFRHVQCETLREDWPERRAEAERRIRHYVESATKDGGRAIVIPFRVAGFGPYGEVLEGLEYVSDGRGFCPHPNTTKWIELTARECLEGTALSLR